MAPNGPHWPTSIPSTSTQQRDTLAPSPSARTGGTAADSRLRIALHLDRSDDKPWLAGEVVRGSLELAVKSNEVELGDIGVEFAGFEGEVD